MKGQTKTPTPTNAEEMRAYLEARAERDDLTGCLIWRGSVTNGNGYPQMRFAGRAALVRRVAYMLIRGRILPGRQIGLQPSCHCLCVDPDHLAQRTRSQAITGHQVAPAVRAKIARTKRERHGKLTPAIASEIRMSSDTYQALADRYGVNKSLVGRIRRGEAWRDYANPFTSLIDGLRA